MAGSHINTRIQLKCDTEANWNKSVLVADGGEKQSGTSFVPMKGEVIIYSAETVNDALPTGRNTPLPFSRLKVGDGSTNVVALPFIDSGSTNNFVLREFQSEFPPHPNTHAFYYEISTNSIYTWTPEDGYQIKYHPITTNINSITSWNPGQMTLLSLDTNSPTLNVINGFEPVLTYENMAIVTSFGLEEV